MARRGPWARRARLPESGIEDLPASSRAIEGEAVPGQISTLYPYIRPAVDQAGPDLTAAIKANAKIQAALLRQASPVLAEQIKKNQLQIVAAYYDLATGKVSMLS